MPVLIGVDPHTGVPVFRQIVDQIRFQIASGVIKAGEELPSTRGLSQDLGVNPMTISKAYVLLEQEGLIERRPGLPVVVRRLNATVVEQERTDLLRAALEPAVIVARQLGISATKATAQFRQLLSDVSAQNEAD